MRKFDWFGVLAIFLFSSIYNPSMVDSFEFKTPDDYLMVLYNEDIKLHNYIHTC